MLPPENNHREEAEALQAPPRLVSALKQFPARPIFIPPMADEAVLRAARRHLGTTAKPTWLMFMPWVAAAAAVVLLIAVARPFFWKPAETPGGGPRLARQDPYRDRHVDILDAFTLARQLKAGAVPDPKFDVNGDGIVDERDVTVLAARAVKLPKGGHS